MDNISSGTSTAAGAPRSGTMTILEQGVLAGTLGGAVVAVWFLVLDAVRADPFYTPSLLGSVIFLQQPVEQVSGVATAMVFAYTGLHGVLFLLAGVVLAWMVAQFEANPQFGMVLLLLFLLFEAIIFGAEVSFVPSLVGALGAWAVAVANVLAAIAMFGFLLRRRPDAMRRLREGWHSDT